jgi:hypothetical protein
VRFVVYLLIGAALVAGAFLGVFGDLHLNRPDPDERKSMETACLQRAGLKVDYDIPSGGLRGTVAPEYSLEVSTEGGDHLAYVFLFDDESSAETYLGDLKSEAAVDAPAKGLKFEQRGSEVLRIFGSEPKASAIRACVDQANKDKK